MNIGQLMTDKFSDIRTDLDIIEALSAGQESNGETYYVDGNAGSDSYDGLTWDTAKQTLAAAITLSNASFSGVPKQWAARNRMFIKGDCFVEDLVDLPSKCDIIGVGSRDSYPTACIMGNHSTFATARMGCRFINVMFIGPAGGGDIITLSSNISGQAFIGCYFDGSTTTPCTGAILFANSPNLEIIGCRFDGPFSDAVIEVGAGDSHHLLIKGNLIHGSNEGISVDSGFLNIYKQAFIIDNVFKTTLACINDASGKIAIEGNRGVTLAARGLHLAGAVIGSEELAIDNVFSCSDGTSEWPLKSTPNPSGGRDYYADGNAGNDNNGGGSWDDAFKTVAVALAASHAWIASGSAGWAARNRVFIKGDAFVEDLVALAQKTDIIGVGTMNGFPMGCIIGNHSTFAAAYGGCRFFNVHFRAPAAGGDIFTLPTGGNIANIEFHGCNFHGNSDTPASGAILCTDVDFLVIKECQFTGGFSDAVIEFAAGTARGLLIEGNYIDGDNEGIAIDASTTCTPEVGIINKNVIHTGTKCINDASSEFIVTNNNCITTQAKGSGHITANQFLSSGNKVNASDLANADWPALGTL